MKTNATRLLDKLQVPYELRQYEVDLEDLSAQKVASSIGFPPEQVFKTLLARGDVNGLVLAAIPGDREVDLKALARASGNRKMELVPVSQLQQLTGYVRGGVTAWACKKNYPVFVDDSVSQHPVISVSAGARGLQVLIAPRDYLQSTNASLAALARSS
jgi:Cys-tRNA(Pro)/Cys-tRNA(Cys) deacylase